MLRRLHGRRRRLSRGGCMTISVGHSYDRARERRKDVPVELTVVIRRPVEDVWGSDA